jgi:uncharacterized protein YxeA
MSYIFSIIKGLPVKTTYKQQERIAMKNCKRFLLMALTVFCITGLTACSNEKTVETPQGKVTVKKTAKGVQVKNKDGSMSMEGDDKAGHIKVKNEDGKNIEVSYSAEKLVEGFPADVPIYAGAKVKTSQLMDKKHAMAMLSTRDSPEETLKFYKAALPNNGWSVENEMTMSGMIMLSGSKGDNKLTVQIVKQGTATNINLTMAGEDKE